MKKVFLQLSVYALFSAGIALTSCNNTPSDSKMLNEFNEKTKTNATLATVRATVNKGVLTLTGQCPDEACRASAEQYAREVKGLKSVVNNITVNETAPVIVADDVTLKNTVDDIVKKYNDVSADVTNGVVTLRGSIKRDDLQKLMMELNSTNPKKINNQLTINQ